MLSGDDSKTDMVAGRPESSKMRVRLDESSQVSKDHHIMSALSGDDFDQNEFQRLREENGELKAKLRSHLRGEAEDAPLGMTTFSPAKEKHT